MRLIIISRNTFATVDLQNVTNIAYSSGVYTVTTSGGNTYNYNSSDWIISLVM